MQLTRAVPCPKPSLSPTPLPFVGFLLRAIAVNLINCEAFRTRSLFPLSLWECVSIATPLFEIYIYRICRENYASCVGKNRNVIKLFCFYCAPTGRRAGRMWTRMRMRDRVESVGWGVWGRWGGDILPTRLVRLPGVALRRIGRCNWNIWLWIFMHFMYIVIVSAVWVLWVCVSEC